MERELFVVQRCWHSGNQQYQPLDYLRLFLSQKDAEEAAFHSACAWDRHHKPTGETSVKTLLLPAYPASNTTGSSYGFISHGCLFWVRSLIAFVGSDQNQGHAVITEGVIGGTYICLNKKTFLSVDLTLIFSGNGFQAREIACLDEVQKYQVDVSLLEMKQQDSQRIGLGIM